MNNDLKPIEKRIFHFSRLPWHIFLLGVFLALLIGFGGFDWGAGLIGGESKSKKTLAGLLEGIEKIEEAQPDLAYKQAEQIIILADALGDISAAAQGYYWLGKIVLVEEKFSENGIEALTYLRIGNELISSIKDPYWKARILNQMASAYSYKGELDSASFFLG